MAGCGGAAPPSGGAYQGPYDPEQLGRWYEDLNQYHSEVKGWSYSSVDHAANRIRIGVTTIESKARLEAVMARVGVPRGAVIIELPEGSLSEADPPKGCQLPLPNLDQEKSGAYSLKPSEVTLRSGQEFTLAVQEAKAPNELTRGIDAYLECFDGTGWSPRYTLFADRGADGPAALIYSPNYWYRIRLKVSGTENGAYKPYQLWTLIEVKP